jgi:drug/metabolite transporter (DMT)-like permease
MLSANEQAHIYRRTRWLYGLGFAFLTASFAAGSSITSEILDDHNKSIYFGLLCCYFTLICVYGPIRATDVCAKEHSLASSGGGEDVVETVMDKKVRTNTFFKRYRICFENVRDQLIFTPNRKSFLLIGMTVLDFAGNYMQMLTYYYTSVSSGSICLSATVPISLLLGYMFMSHSYKRLHIVGSCIACGGLLFMISFDSYDAKYLDGGKPDEINPALGDCLGLLAALFNSLSYVMQEYLIEAGTCENEIMTAFGVYGCVTSLLSLFIQYGCSYADLIRFFKSIRSHYEWTIYGSLALCEFCLHLSAFHSLSRVDAGTFNVVMLGQPLMVGIVRLCGFDGGFRMMQAVFFFITLVVQTSGIALFSYAGDVKEDEDEKNALSSESEGKNPEEEPLLSKN